jgi:hypothetical protein
MKGGDKMANKINYSPIDILKLYAPLVVSTTRAAHISDKYEEYRYRAWRTILLDHFSSNCYVLNKRA